MYAVIFKAKAAFQDAVYAQTVAKLREQAFSRYGCLDFIAVTEGETEIAISYWPDEEAIRRWKQDTEHLMAQHEGRQSWYQSYQVQVVEIKREYRFQNNDLTP